MSSRLPFTRRNLLAYALTAGGLAAAAPWLAGRSAAQTRRPLGLATVALAASPPAREVFTKLSGWPVKAIAISDQAEAIRNLLRVEIEAGSIDLLHATGGMVQPLVSNDLIVEMKTDRLRNWKANSYIQSFFAPGTPGYSFIGQQKWIYGAPTILQGDSFAYLPEVTGSLTSYAALFDPQWRGRVALEDEPTSAGHKTALYLKTSGMAEILDPADPTPEEIRVIIDFLIEKKREGQFKALWKSQEEATKLLASKEVVVMDCWEPVVAAVRGAGVNAVYAVPTEGHLLWATTVSIVRNEERSEEELQGAYALIDFLLSGWYGAWIALHRGFMTNPGALAYVTEHPEEFTADEAVRIQALDSGGRFKFEKSSLWRNRWPTHRQDYEVEWARLKRA